MQPLARWTLAKVLVISGAWFVLTQVTPIAWLMIKSAWASSTSDGGLVAVSVGISELFLVVVSIGPPLLLIVAWLILKRTRSESGAT